MSSSEGLKNTEESIPVVSLFPKEVFASKLSPIFESDIIDVITGEKIGRVDFQLNHREKTIIIQSVQIDKPRQGYGVSLYKLIQSLYPKYQLQSSDGMVAKSDESQEKPNAVYLWEKLVQLGYAEECGNGEFKMKIKKDLL